MYKVEFHVHTKSSKDSTLNFMFLKLACKIKGVNCIAITDHNEIAGALKCKENFEKKGISVIVGEEIFTKDGEIIGLYLKDKIEPGKTCEETINQIKKQGGLVYIPHPYEPYREKTVLKEKCIKDFQNDIDMIECHNGRNRELSISNYQENICNNYHLRKVVGSDAHTFFEIGRNYMYLNSIDRAHLLEAIDNCENIQKKECIKLAHTWTKVAKALKLLKGGDFSELCRIINRKCKKKM